MTFLKRLQKRVNQICDSNKIERVRIYIDTERDNRFGCDFEYIIISKNVLQKLEEKDIEFAAIHELGHLAKPYIRGHEGEYNADYFAVLNNENPKYLLSSLYRLHLLVNPNLSWEDAMAYDSPSHPSPMDRYQEVCKRLLCRQEDCYE